MKPPPSPLAPGLLLILIPAVCSQSIPKNSDTYNPQCTHFTRFVPGMTCASIASRYNIALSDVYAWNAEINKDCNNLKAVYYVCVHVLDGPGVAQTISYDLNYPTRTAGPHSRATAVQD
ncbi:hypothetical protein QBC44DRAFT_397529 [Cladorrhinum sp. PSN332]|nr:hypothetical protein QBC44DRAFT_397529 [Cladorrhinum sp. PSN332]